MPTYVSLQSEEAGVTERQWWFKRETVFILDRLGVRCEPWPVGWQAFGGPLISP